MFVCKTFLTKKILRDNIIDLIILKEQLEKETKRIFNSFDGHECYHAMRVCNLAETLQKEEGGNIYIIVSSAYLHDVHRTIQNINNTYCSPKDSLHQVEKILKNTDIPPNYIHRILHCIEYHEEYSFSKNGQTVDDIETLILQDADNLDAIGAIGIGRTFAYGGANELPMWLPNKSFERESYEEGTDDSSIIHHFYSKLLKLKENMNTKTAEKMAEKRSDFMNLFLKQFFAEWKGEC